MSFRSATRSLRVVFVVVLTLLATLCLAGTASAHATLIGSDPADGATLQAAPASVTLTFDDSLENFEPVVTVSGPDGLTYQSGPATIDGATLSNAVQPLTAAGTYTIAYRVVSDDGHPVEGQVRFEFAPPPSTSAAPPPPVSTVVSSSATPTSTAAASASTSSTQPTVSSGATDEAASTSSGGPSAIGWISVLLFVILAFGATMIVRRRLEARHRAQAGPDETADGPGST